MATTQSQRRRRGFTLVELMIVIAVLAIVSAIALPNMRGVIASNRVVSETNELLASLSLARMESIRQNTSVVGNRDIVLCPSTNGTSCAATWGTGWIVATRVDDAVVTVLRHSTMANGVSLTAASAEIVFDNRGRLLTGPPSLTLTATTCKTGESHRRTITINASGQVRVVTAACP